MSTKNTKKKNDSILNSKNLIVLGISAAVVILFSVITTIIFPPNTPDEFKEASTGTTNIKDSGLTSVYTEEAIQTAGDVQEPAPKEENSETPTPPAEENATQTSYIPPVSGSVINDYSGDELVYSKTLKDWRTHNGIDFYAEEGTDVLASADGSVESILENGMFGRTVILLHNNGVRTIYSNLAEGNEVVIGDNIKQGTPVGKVGSSASAEALDEPHIHFEVSLNEEPVNPHDYLPDTSSNEE